MERSTAIGWALGVLVGAALLAACGGTAIESGPGPTTTSSTGGGGSGNAGGSGGSGNAGGSGGSGGSGNAGGQGASGGAGGGCGCSDLEQCWNGQLCVALSVTVAGGYAIDATEITRSQYQAWLATNPSTAGQGAACSWNDSLEPDPTCMQSSAVCQGNACSAHPQPCIDLCDALAYCAAVGKRVCGKIGGGPVTGNPADPVQSQWHHACTSGGVNDFTYGNSVASGTCNDYMLMQTTTVPVGSMAGCQSPLPDYDGVFDLIGNLGEWEDNCNAETGPSDVCEPRGLSFGMGAALPMCDSADYAERSDARDNLGFRCCVP